MTHWMDVYIRTVPDMAVMKLQRSRFVIQYESLLFWSSWRFELDVVVIVAGRLREGDHRVHVFSRSLEVENQQARDSGETQYFASETVEDLIEATLSYE